MRERLDLHGRQALPRRIEHAQGHHRRVRCDADDAKIVSCAGRDDAGGQRVARVVFAPPLGSLGVEALVELIAAYANSVVARGVVALGALDDGDGAEESGRDDGPEDGDLVDGREGGTAIGPLGSVTAS